MADANFQDLLNAPVSEVARPKPMPTGSYVWTIGDFKFDKSSKKKTDFVQFKLIPAEAMEDVDPDELREFLGDKSLTEVSKTVDFYMTADAIYRLDEFLLEIVGTTAGTPRAEQINEAKGRQVVGMVTHTPSSRDENTMYANVDKFAAYEG